MVRWQLLTNEEAESTWDQTLTGFPDCTPYQSYAWGEYRRALGWEPLRWIAVDDNGKVMAMMQGALRRYPFGVGLIWCEGGPVGDLTACNDSLQQVMSESTGLRRFYCRFRCDRRRDIEDVLRLTAQSWATSWSPLTSNYSMALDLSPEEDRLLANCDRNWRRNLRRADECNLKVRQWLDAGVDEVLSVYSSMQEAKGLDEQLSRKEVEELLRSLKQQLVLYRCDDANDEVVSLLGCMVVGDQACAVFWATSEAGRKNNASYATFWAVVQHCRRIGIKSYDLAGIDPVRNHGVYRFKRATGAAPIEYLGEWDCASRPWMRWFGNWAVSRRARLNWTATKKRTAASTAPAPVVATNAEAIVS
jgi:lipid II:glycine glycyltransferase (peptidoglycan interpeptide bridge formation enzyme)